VALTRVGDVRDQAGEVAPALTPDATGAWPEVTILRAFRPLDVAIIVDPEEKDMSVHVLEFKWDAPRRTLMRYLAADPLRGSLIVTADYDRLLDLVRRLWELPCGGFSEGASRLGLRQTETARPPHDLTHQLLSFAGLPRGWDGYRAEPIEHRTVERAVRLLNYLYGRAADERLSFEAPVLGPTPGGSIQLEWNLASLFLSVEIPAAPKPLSFYFERSDGKQAGNDAASLQDVWEIVKAGLAE
jgi:hypothetical protein